MRQIAIVGAGNLGGRHLQALAMLKEPANIYIVDVSEDSLSRAVKWFNEKKPESFLSLKALTNIGDLPNEIDLLINATSANVRAWLTARLLKEKEIKYMILEKVLFQREADYDSIGELIAKSNCKTWVNCPRRTVSFYQTLSEIVRGQTEIEFCMSGVNWGLGCNTVHFLDLLAFLTGDTSFVLSSKKLDAEIEESKRKGFKEFTGTLTGHCASCAYISLTSKKEGQEPPLITLRNPNFACLIKESEQKAYLMRSDNKWVIEEYSLNGKYQSDLTNLIAENIFENGECELTPYNESVEIHLPFIRVMLDFINNNKKVEERTDICPIT